MTDPGRVRPTALHRAFSALMVSVARCRQRGVDLVYPLGDLFDGAILEKIAGDAGFDGLVDGLSGMVRQDEDVNPGQLLFDLTGGGDESRRSSAGSLRQGDRYRVHRTDVDALVTRYALISPAGDQYVVTVNSGIHLL